MDFKKLTKVIILVMATFVLFEPIAFANSFVFDNKGVKIKTISLTDFKNETSDFNYDGTLLELYGTNNGTKFYAQLVFKNDDLYLEGAEYVTQTVATIEDAVEPPTQGAAYLISKNIKHKKGTDITKTFSSNTQGIGKISIIKLSDKFLTFKFKFNGKGIDMTVKTDDVGADEKTFQLPSERVRLRSFLKINYLKNFL